ncbi:uncharacterized protein [Euwallacea fornicatus]|uniref:uncharacterized protein n=1 Tax=Euwallacea fornicatus TaxID=995702 RepID=UPI00338F90CA
MDKKVCLKDGHTTQGMFKTLFMFLSHHKLIKTADMLREELGYGEVNLEEFPSTSLLLVRCECSRNQIFQIETQSTARCSQKSDCLDGPFQGEPFQDDARIFYVCEHSNKDNQVEKNCTRDHQSTVDVFPRYKAKELKSKFSQLQVEHHKLIEVTSELTTALQINLISQTKNINSVLEQCKTIYPSLFHANRHSIISPESRSQTPSSQYRNKIDNKNKNEPQNTMSDVHKDTGLERKFEVFHVDVKEPVNTKRKRANYRTSESSEIQPQLESQHNNNVNLNLEKVRSKFQLNGLLTPETVRFVLESVFERIFQIEKVKEQAVNVHEDNKSMGQPLTRGEVERIVGDVLDEAINSSTTDEAEEKESLREELSTPRNLNNLECLDYSKLKCDLIHGNNERKTQILQALRWKITTNHESSRTKVLDSYVSNDILDLFSDISIPERLLLGDDSDNYVQESFYRLINTLASLKQGRDYLTLDERLLKIVLIKKVKDVRNLPGTATRNVLIASMQKLSIKKQCRVEMVKNGLFEVIVDYMDEFYENLPKYCLVCCSALLMNLCLVNEAKISATKNAMKVVRLLRKFLESESEACLPYINGVMLSLFEKSEIVDEANRQALDKLMVKIFQATHNVDVKKNLGFILQSRLAGGSAFHEDRDKDGDNEEVDLLEANLDQDNLVAQLPSGDVLLQTYLNYENPQTSLPLNNLISGSPPLRSLFNEESKRFEISATTNPRRFMLGLQNSIRSNVRTTTFRRYSRGCSQYPVTPLCYMENCQKLQKDSNAQCSCSKCVPGQSRYSCGCYDAICKDIAENGDNLVNVNVEDGESNISHGKSLDSTITNADRQSAAEECHVESERLVNIYNNIGPIITNKQGGRTGSGCKVCGEKRCECAFDPRPKLCRTPTL